MSRRGRRYSSKRFKILKNQATICYYCFRTLTPTNSRGVHGDSDISVDHFIPLGRGGSSATYNRVVCCYNCNILKGDMLPHEFLVKLNDMLHSKNNFTYSKLDLKNIQYQIKFIRRVYKLHHAANTAFILHEQPNIKIGIGMIESLRKKYIKNAKLAPCNNKHRQTA